MTAFSDCNYIRRFTTRDCVDDHGGYVSGYQHNEDGSSLCVAMPTGRARSILHLALTELGLRRTDSYRFPLGSDVNGLPDHLNHNGYWLYNFYEVTT